MTMIKIGCGPFPPSRRAYFERFRTVELSDTWFEPVGDKTLTKWKNKAPEDFDYHLAAWGWLTFDPLDADGTPPFAHPKRDFGLLQPTEANREVWQVIDRQARTLGARSVLLKTPATFAPSTRSRDHLEAFKRDIIGEVPYQLLWEPRGIWDAEERLAWADEYGLTLVVDPHGEDRRFPEPPEGDAYYAITAPWGRTYFSKDDLFDLFDFLQGHQGTTWVVFRGQDRQRNAEGLVKVLAEELGL
jgi:uncharacterized protein YecE (DUF72 family)